VVDAFSRIAIDQQAKRIAPGELGDLLLRVLPALPKPTLVMIASESDCVAADDFGIWRHEAHVAPAVEVGDYDQQAGAGEFLRH
jgi:hypothetical protein